MVDIKALKAVAKAKLNTPEAVFALLVGPSGFGKSSMIGTLKGTTLFIHTRSEHHGLRAAAALGGDMLGICIDMKEEIDGSNYDDVVIGDLLSPDQAYDKLVSVLSSDLSGIDNIAVDSLSDLDLLLKRTSTFTNMCQTDKGRHNKFAEPEASIKLIRGVVDLLGTHHARGKNVVVTLAARVKERDGDGKLESVELILSTYGCAEQIPRLFSEVLLLDIVEVDEEKRHACVFLAQVKREAKDVSGTVKKAMSFEPRITGVTRDKLPAFCKADFNKISELKTKG
jgi:hypothetical protein